MRERQCPACRAILCGCEPMVVRNAQKLRDEAAMWRERAKAAEERERAATLMFVALLDSLGGKVTIDINSIRRASEKGREVTRTDGPDLGITFVFKKRRRS